MENLHRRLGGNTRDDTLVSEILRLKALASEPKGTGPVWYGTGLRHNAPTKPGTPVKPSPA